MSRKKDCYCSGLTHENGSLILCDNCENSRLKKLIKSAAAKFSNNFILKTFFQDQAYEDYDFSENDGYVDHEVVICKLCYLCQEETRKKMLSHFYNQHWGKV